MKTSELTGAALDWAVTIIEMRRMIAEGIYVKAWVQANILGGTHRDPYSDDWVWGGPIIEREKIAVTCSPVEWMAYSASGEHEGLPAGQRAFRWVGKQVGPTPLVAAMRCYVASKLGDEVEVPEGLA